MTREIKFRYFWKEKMYIVDMLDFVNQTVAFRFLNEKLEMEGGFVKIEEGKLMQFTGLKDKNGKEIYEGDILESNILLGDGKIRRVVSWVEACFIGNGLLSNEKVYMTNHQPEIIGNIWETPELIK